MSENESDIKLDENFQYVMVGNRKPPKNDKIGLQEIDQIGLTLLLINMYGQDVVAVDWDPRRGDLFLFEDSPIVRTCIALWREAIQTSGRSCFTTIEQYLFSLLDFETHDIFLEQETLSRERQESINQVNAIMNTDENQ